MRRFGAGQKITAKGEICNDDETGRTMFFIVSGWVEIRFHEEGGGHSSLQVGENSALGEMSFLSGKASIATAVARGEVFALEVDEPSLQKLKAQNPEASEEFSAFLTATVDRRLRANA